MARQAGGLLPFFRTPWTDTCGIEGVPSAMAAGVAVPAIVLLGFPAAARAADPPIVRAEELLLHTGRAAMDQEGKARKRQ